MIIESGDKVEVKGGKTAFAADPATIAAEVKKGDGLFGSCAMTTASRFGVAGAGVVASSCIAHVKIGRQ